MPNAGENMLYLEPILRTTFGLEGVLLMQQLRRRQRRRRRDSLATVARHCGRRCSRRRASPSRALSQTHSESRRRVAPPGIASSHKDKSVRPHTPKTRSPLTTRTRAVLEMLVSQSSHLARSGLVFEALEIGSPKCRGCWWLCEGEPATAP